MNSYYMFLVFLFGASIGSFLAAFTYRYPRKLSMKGRSFCDACKTKISWYDNLPLLSFLLLEGKCRKCQAKISLRYFLIELAVALGFLVLFLLFPGSFLFLWAVFAISVAIFVIDLEERVIPDDLVFSFAPLSFVFILITPEARLYERLFSGFAAAFFLLLIFFLTKGKGMGLGDVKLVIPLGFTLGALGTISFVWLAFMIGAVVGIFLIFLGKKKLKSEVAFGPFLITSFWLIYLFGNFPLKLFGLI